jgi:protein-disulfide isomerase
MNNKIKVFLIIAGIIVVFGAIGIWLSLNKETTYIAVNSARPIRGNPEASILIEEFSDFQCPACKSAQGVVDLVVSKYSDQVKFIYYHFPLTQIHPLAFRAALAAECANDQGKFWEYHDLLFLSQPKFSRTELLSYAEGLGLDSQSFTACLDERAKDQVIKTDMAEGNSRNIQGTPTFFVNGEIVKDWSKLEQTVLDLLPQPSQATSTVN